MLYYKHMTYGYTCIYNICIKYEVGELSSLIVDEGNIRCSDWKMRKETLRNTLDKSTVESYLMYIIILREILI